jgi:hypothetical protein
VTSNQFSKMEAKDVAVNLSAAVNDNECNKSKFLGFVVKRNIKK